MKSNKCALALFATLLAAASGVISQAQGASAPADPVTAGKKAISRASEKDKVLLGYKTALTALRIGQYEDAKKLLDDAFLRLGKHYSADKGYSENAAKKTFLGEPYERVMASYYRGILSWMDGDLENARQCFKNGQAQDLSGEENGTQSDYALLHYLEGLAVLKLGGNPAEMLQRAKDSAKLSFPLEYEKEANVLFFVEFGRGPTKVAAGEYKEQLRFNPGSSQSSKASITISNLNLALGPYDDLTYQATTRSGRVVEYVDQGKAVFKTVTGVTGVAAMGTGAALMTSHHTAGAGAVTLGVGALVTIASIATDTHPKADVRCWDTLPQYLSFAALRAAPGTYTARIDFIGDGDLPVAGQSKQITFTVTDPQKDIVIFLSDQ